MIFIYKSYSIEVSWITWNRNEILNNLLSHQFVLITSTMDQSKLFLHHQPTVNSNRIIIPWQLLKLYFQQLGSKYVVDTTLRQFLVSQHSLFTSRIVGSTEEAAHEKRTKTISTTFLSR
jgi:hypothetical protein